MTAEVVFVVWGDDSSRCRCQSAACWRSRQHPSALSGLTGAISAVAAVFACRLASAAEAAAEVTMALVAIVAAAMALQWRYGEGGWRAVTGWDGLWQHQGPVQAAVRSSALLYAVCTALPGIAGGTGSRGHRRRRRSPLSRECVAGWGPSTADTAGAGPRHRRGVPPVAARRAAAHQPSLRTRRPAAAHLVDVGGGGGRSDSDGDKDTTDPRRARLWVLCGGGGEHTHRRFFPNAAAPILSEEAHARGCGGSQ